MNSELPQTNFINFQYTNNLAQTLFERINYQKIEEYLSLYKRFSDRLILRTFYGSL
jgi:hypothetical protein